MIKSAKFKTTVESQKKAQLCDIRLRKMPCNSIFTTQVHLHNVYIKFVYRGHQVKVKVKVAGAKSS